jgi:hypothetical protein
MLLMFCVIDCSKELSNGTRSMPRVKSCIHGMPNRRTFTSRFAALLVVEYCLILGVTNAVVYLPPPIIRIIIISPPFFASMTQELKPKTSINNAYCLLNLGDSITTDHISPAGNISARSPAARYLTDRGYVGIGTTSTTTTNYIPTWPVARCHLIFSADDAGLFVFG